MPAPLVSIIMAAYNEEKYIKDAIESVLGQTYTNIELVIVNDGSTDSTEEIIRSFADSRIRYIRNEKNLKLIASLNKGLMHAGGELIARMDADDICFPGRIEKQVAFMEANPGVGISGAQLELFGDLSGSMNYPLSHEDIQLRLLVTSCFGNNVVIFRKHIFEAHKLLFPEGYFHAEDYKCWTNWIRYTRLANIDENLVKYRAHAGSVSVKNRKAQRTTRDRIRVEYLGQLFGLEEGSRIAADFYGSLSGKRIRAAKYILAKNKEKAIVPQEKLHATIGTLWYSDALERAEDNIFVFFPFVYIFSLPGAGSFGRWINILKHWAKQGTWRKKNRS